MDKQFDAWFAKPENWIGPYESQRQFAERVWKASRVLPPIDLNFVAKHCPHFTIKDMAVIAMAMGGQLSMGTLESNGFHVEFDETSKP